MPDFNARPLPRGYHFENLTIERLADVVDLDAWAFPIAQEPAALAKHPSPLTWSRTVGVVSEEPDPYAVPVDGAVPERADLAAMHSSFPFAEFPVPGASAPAGGLTWVGVHPAHRRKGLLTAMIDYHFTRCLKRGESFSALFAAEPAIYGRFGYGPGAHEVNLRIPRKAQLRDVRGADQYRVRIEKADQDRHGELVAGVHGAAGRAGTLPDGTTANRPGWVGRVTPQLEKHWWADPEWVRDGAESRRIAIVEADGQAQAYAVFRRTSAWDHRGPQGVVKVHEAVALNAGAAHALWSVLTDLDLTVKVETGMLAPDDPVLSLLVDRRICEPRLIDNLWVRVLDVPTALSARRYQSDIDVVLHVTDSRIPQNAGHWRIRGDAFEPAKVTATGDAADLSVDIRELSAAFLGGTSLASLGAAGLVAEHTPGSLASTSAAFGWPVAPLSSYVW